MKTENEYYLAVLNHLEHDRFEEAIRIATEGLSLYPDFAILYKLRAIGYESIQSINKAIRDLSSFIQLESNNLISIFWRARLYQQTDQFMKAIEDLSRIIDLNPQAPFYYQRTLSFIEIGDTERAKLDLEEIKNFDSLYVHIAEDLLATLS